MNETIPRTTPETRDIEFAYTFVNLILLINVSKSIQNTL